MKTTISILVLFLVAACGSPATEQVIAPLEEAVVAPVQDAAPAAEPVVEPVSEDAVPSETDFALDDVFGDGSAVDPPRIPG